jgi:hypothetical protein
MFVAMDEMGTARTDPSIRTALLTSLTPHDRLG